MEKVIRDNKVAVIYSPGFGAGWYTWHYSKNKELLLFHPKLVEMIENNKRNEITEEWVAENIGLHDVYCGGAGTLRIEWIPVGARFEVDEYDGAESINIIDYDKKYLIA
jgi:hypothetical protein